MLPEFNLKKVKLKVSTDNASLIFGYLVFGTSLTWYIATREWHRTSLVGFGVIAALTVMQFAALRIPQTKNLEIFNSGGLAPLLIYNIGMSILLIWYFPLYSPFLLIIPTILWITVYYRGTITALLTIAELIFIVGLGTHLQGLPHVPYARALPFIIIVLGIAFIGTVSRAGYIENGVRIALGKAANKIAEESQQLVTLINSMADAVVAVDTSGNVLFYNRAANDLLETQINLGQSLDKLIELFDEKNGPQDLLKLLSGKKGPIRFNNFHILEKNKEQVDLAIDISPIHPQEGVTQDGYIVIMRDITKEKSLEEEKDEFIAITSHELRTPIAVAEANMSLAISDNAALQPALRENLDDAHQSVMLLADITNKLITLSEAEQNRLHIVLSPVDIHDLCFELEKKYKKIVAGKDLHFVVSVAPELTTVSTSKQYLNEILDNFLSNAFKYTESGYVRLTAKLNGDKQVEFSVEDTGKGISKADQEKIFGKFYQSEDYSTREKGGTGLGLYVAARLAGVIGAKIWVKSELNLGSTFYVSIKSN